MQDRRILLFPLGAAVGLLVVAGVWWLTRPRPFEFVEVHGVVRLNGKPLDNAEIQFIPDPEKGTPGPVSCCFTDSDGRYAVRCDKFERGGAIVGIHRVTVFDITVYGTVMSPAELLEAEAAEQPEKARRAKGKRTPTPVARAAPGRVPKQYEHLSTTPFRGVEVKPGHTEMNFDLVGKR